jgi:hypothetical protein
MPIAAPLFAGIENDPFLTGMYNLEGTRFLKNVEYLDKYLNQLRTAGEPVPPEYLTLLNQMKSFVTIEQSLEGVFKGTKPASDVDTIANTIATDLMSMPENSTLLVPGGWHDADGGHAMVYPFKVTKNGFDFTAINSGDGLEYHAKKSSREKELYNPTKSWQFSRPTTPQEIAELVGFITRLLKARLPVPAGQQKRPMSAKALYEEIFPSISYLGGVEVEANRKVPEYAFTGGQLSGTCAERCLHQMLKIHSKSLTEYQRFIFKFKLYALFDYSQECFEGREPFNSAVAHQMHLAIENNLKILNIPGLFSETEVRAQVSKLETLQQKLNETALVTKKAAPRAPETAYSFTATGTSLQAPHVSLDRPFYGNSLPAFIDLNDGTKLLANMTAAISYIESMVDPADQYVYLEQLLLQLPLKTSFLMTDSFYREFKTMYDFGIFKNILERLHTILLGLQEKMFQDEQIPAMNVLNLSLISLQLDTKEIIPAGSSLPSFLPFTSTVMRSIVGNLGRDPFTGTNHPALDQRLIELQDRYKSAPEKTMYDLFQFFKKLIQTESTLNAELKALYQQDFANDTTELHNEIRGNGLESVFMVARHIDGTKRLADKFRPIIATVESQIDHDTSIRKAINYLYVKKYTKQFSINRYEDYFRINSGLFPTFVPYEELEKGLSTSKYKMKESPARESLEADHSVFSDYIKPIIFKTANAIQLQPGKNRKDTESTQRVTQADIKARVYQHLRSVPSLQISLTLDYFTRTIKDLSEESDQRYVEANLFQPGLLLQSIKDPEFISQFDKFLETGQRYFTNSGQHTRNSLIYVRLDYLFSRYQVLNKDPVGVTRLKNMQVQLEKQLSISNNPDVTYFLRQYLFLNIMTRIDMGEFSEELFVCAYKAYSYINSHTNPSILEDLDHRSAVDAAKARFKILARRQPNELIKRSVKQSLTSYEKETRQDLEISGTFPLYKLANRTNGSEYQFNALLGKMFENGLAHSGVPLVIQNHALIKQLDLHRIRECLVTSDERYIILADKGTAVRLYYNDNKLTVEKDWSINGRKSGYELQALTKDHLAQHAHKDIGPITMSLPRILTDGSMDYWKSTTNIHTGLLVQNNIPKYVVKSGVLCALDAKGNETGYQVTVLGDSPLRKFESNEFLIASSDSKNSIVQLPRFNLNFDLKGGTLINQETKEQVVDMPSPIHPAVAGLVLGKGKPERYIVPIARFYATEQEAEESYVYPVVHDISGTIADARMNVHWANHPPLQKPMWHHSDTCKFLSFNLKNGEPVADNVADALYLVYIYLATNQTEKAWNMLEECNTRLGGLKGNSEELRFISWICKDVPHILPSDKTAFEQSKPIRSTPPYVACQLKAMSLLCDHLNRGGDYNLQSPSLKEGSANAQYVALQEKEHERFLSELPETLYQSFTRLQSMRRHLEHTYTLSALERKRLLHYYHSTLPKDNAPQGALGYEWMSLSLESLLEERNLLLARYSAEHTLSKADKNRLDLIESRLKKLKPVVAKSTALEQVSIDLSLPNTSTINRTHLKPATVTQLDTWHHRLPGTPLDAAALGKAVDALSSSISEDDFIINFPAYLQLALKQPPFGGIVSFIGNLFGSRTDPQMELQKKLLGFCSNTLIAHRHIRLENQDSNIPLLCNMLYRVLENRPTISDTKFTDLVTQLSPLNVPPLKVYQAKDVYQDILGTPEELLTRPAHPIRAPLRTTKKTAATLLVQTGIDAKLQADAPRSKELLERLIAQYNELQEQCDNQIAKLGTMIKNDMEHNFATEKKAGKILFDFEQKKRVIAESLANNRELVQVILNASTFADTQLKTQIEKSWAEALKLANQGPDDPAKARVWKIEKQAKARATLTHADLLSLYSRSDTAYSIEQTGLSPENAQRLHDLIHQALTQGIQSQSVDKISDNLKKSLAQGKVKTAIQALDVLARQEIPGLDDPSVVIIQHEDKILLRKRQVKAIKSLMEPGEGRRFKETIEKVIPGGGKSKVVNPIVAEKKARGDNLVIIETTKALLATYQVDANRISQRLFNKRAYFFEFSREDDCSPERLEQMYDFFVEIMVTRSYLVSTVESMKSLELKYIELLLSENEGDKTWDQQVYWLDKINNLMRHHGDTLIDESHQGLALKQKLNYTLGEPKPLSALFIKNATALFSFIKADVIKNAPSYDADYDWNPFKTELATQIITNPSSPLYEFATQAVARYATADKNGPAIQKELIDYLTNNSGKHPEAVLRATADEKESLAFFKHEITVRLSQTLSQQVDKHYGASKKEGLSAVERTLAIPYAASNVPNERNRFANEFESVNKVIQMMLLKGIDAEQLAERIDEWQILARQELFQIKTIKHLDQTPIAQGFALLTSGLGLTLSQIDSKNTTQMAELNKHLQSNRTLIFDYLRTFSLKQIKQDAAIISSDNFNHVDQFSSVQCETGTPSLNPMAHHSRNTFDQTVSLGSDYYILEVIRSKKPDLSYLDYENATQFITTILKQSKSLARARSIIDINGTITGISNLDAAKVIAAYIKKNPSHFSKPLKHVLYFNEQDVLCAIDVNKPGHPIVIGSSDTKEIDRVLDSTPGERFTFLDQFHTTGIDLTQDEEAHAIVLGDDKMVLQQYVQGWLRHRDYEYGQTEEFFVPTRLNDLALDDFFDAFEHNAKNGIVIEAPSAARSQMKSRIRRNFLDIIQDLPSEEASQKRALMKHFKPFFEERTSSNLFALHGGISKKQTIADILGQYKTHLHALREECLKAANHSPSAKDIQEMDEVLKGLIDKATPICLPEYEGSDDSYAAEVEIQNEVQKEVEAEVFSANETYDGSFKEAAQLDWPRLSDFNKFFLNKDSVDRAALSLNAVCKREKAELPTVFSDHLMASKNYAQTYEGQKQYTGVFLKPVFLVWYHLHNDTLHATIVTPQEAKQLGERIKDLPSSWISTTQDRLISGKRPAGILEEVRYQRLREQVRFFNGEFVGLLNQEEPLIWMKENPVEKMAFFEDNLMPYRPGSASELQQLRSALTQGKAEGFAYIAEHPFEDLTRFNWLSVFPKTIPAQAAEYKRVAEAFVYLNNNWKSKTISIDDLQQEFRLPLNSLAYVNAHLNLLKTLNKMRERLKSLSLERPFLLDLAEEEQNGIATCLGMTISHFYDLRNITPLRPGEVPNAEQLKKIAIASIQAVNILSGFPALKDEQLFHMYFEAYAKQATSKDELLALLSTANPSNVLFKNSVENPLFDSEHFVFLLELKIDLSVELLGSLVKHYKGIIQIELLLKQVKLNEETLLALLSKQALTDDELLLVLKHPTAVTPEVLKHIIGLGPLSSKVFQALVSHSVLNDQTVLVLLSKQAMTEDELLLVLKHPTAFTPEVLKHILGLPSVSSKVLMALLLFPQISHQLISTVISHKNFSVEHGEKILGGTINSDILKNLAARALDQLSIEPGEKWEEFLDKVFNKSKPTKASREMIPLIGQKKAVIRPDFALKIFKQLGENTLQHLSLPSMIKIASEKDLDAFIQLGRRFSDQEIMGLVNKAQNLHQIDNLLVRPEMNSELANTLFQKAAYSGKIDNWEWLTTEQLQNTLEKTRDYDSLNLALNHPNFPPRARQEWLDKKNEQQKNALKKDVTAVTPQEKLELAIDKLKIKAIAHAIKANDNDKYGCAARAAFVLYTTLDAQAKSYFKNPTAENAKKFKAKCRSAIDSAKPVLGEHRGYKQILVDIINAVLVIFALIKKGKWRFFQVDTDSVKEINKVGEIINDQNPEQKGVDDDPPESGIDDLSH